jgi:hypothetical protein
MNNNDSRLDGWIYWCFFTITLVTINTTHSYEQYSTDLYTFHFTAIHALGFSFSTSRILAMELNTETITSNHYEVFLPILKIRPNSLPTGHSTRTQLPVLQSNPLSQSYFTTDGLPPISSSWRQAPWDPRPDFFFFDWTPAVIVLM